MLPHWVEKLPKELLNLRCLSHFFFERKKRHLILILFFFPECLFLLHLLGVSVLTLLELGSYWTQNVKCFRQDGKNSISYRMPAEIWVNWCFGILQMFCWVWWLVRLHLELPEKKILLDVSVMVFPERLSCERRAHPDCGQYCPRGWGPRQSYQTWILGFISLLDSTTVGRHNVTSPSAATASASFSTMPAPWWTLRLRAQINPPFFQIILLGVLAQKSDMLGIWN